MPADDAAVHSDADELADAVDELASFLGSNGQRTLADQAANAAQRVRRGDDDCIERLLSDLEPMHALVDVALRSSNVGDEFGRLLDAAWYRAISARAAARPAGSARKRTNR